RDPARPAAGRAAAAGRRGGGPPGERGAGGHADPGTDDRVRGEAGGRLDRVPGDAELAAPDRRALHHRADAGRARDGVMTPGAFDPTAPGALALIALLGARVGGLLLIAPALSGRPVPMMVRTALLVLLTMVLLPASAAAAAGGAVPRVTAATLLCETLIGMALGLGAAVFVGAAEAAGDLISVQMGLSAAAVLDPVTQQSTPTLASFTRLFATALLFAVGGHLAMIGALASSVDLLPVGGEIDA